VGGGHGEGLNYTDSDVDSGEDNHTPRKGRFIITLTVSRSKGVDAS